MDSLLILVQGMLMGLSILGVTSSDPQLLPRHMVNLGLMVVATLIGSRLPIPFLIRHAKLAFFITLPLLIAVKVFGTGPISNGVVISDRWFDLGPINFQPSELLKIVLVFYLASYFATKGTDYPILGPVVTVGIAAFLVVLQPDVSAGGFVLFLTAFLLMVVGVPWRRLLVVGSAFLLLLALAAGVVGSAYPERFAYFSERFTGFLLNMQGKADPLASSGYQFYQAQKAIVGGGWAGQGPSSLPPALPNATEDLMLASIAWAGGWVSALMLLLAYLVLMARGLQIAARSEGAFSVVAVGLTGYLGFQALMNMAETLGVFPITGSTLPMVSYGGNSMLVAGLAMGLLHGLWRHCPQPRGGTAWSW